MRILIIILLAGLVSLAMAALLAGNTLAQQDLVVAPYLAAGTAAIFALGNDASVPVLTVKVGKGGKGHGRFRGGFFLGGYPGWGYGWYGGYPFGYGYSGSYLDTPTRTCTWNGYEYRCWEFPSGDSYLY
jgi:hypothetical protein